MYTFKVSVMIWLKSGLQQFASGWVVSSHMTDSSIAYSSLASLASIIPLEASRVCIILLSSVHNTRVCVCVCMFLSYWQAMVVGLPFRVPQNNKGDEMNNLVCVYVHVRSCEVPHCIYNNHVLLSFLFGCNLLCCFADGANEQMQDFPYPWKSIVVIIAHSRSFRSM